MTSKKAEPKKRTVSKTVHGRETEAMVQVTSTYLDQKYNKRQQIKVRPFVTTPARISIKKGLPVSVGDQGRYAWISVEVSCPCYIEELRSVYDQVSQEADVLIELEMERLNG